MTKKTLDTKRAYGLMVVLVIVVTVYFSYEAIIHHQAVGRWENEKANCVARPQDYGDDCLIISYRAIASNEQVEKRNTYLAVAIPLVFFGGTALYKYLFRNKEEA